MSTAPGLSPHSNTYVFVILRSYNSKCCKGICIVVRICYNRSKSKKCRPEKSGFFFLSVGSIPPTRQLRPRSVFQLLLVNHSLQCLSTPNNVGIRSRLPLHSRPRGLHSICSEPSLEPILVDPPSTHQLLVVASAFFDTHLSSGYAQCANTHTRCIYRCQFAP